MASWLTRIDREADQMSNIRFTIRVVGSAIVMAALAACGGSGTSGIEPSPTFGGVLGASSNPTFAELEPVLDAAAAQETRVRGFAGSRFTAIPDDRTVTFKGYGRVGLDFDPATSEDVTVIGDSRVVIDFATDQFSGSVTNMVATDESNNVLGVVGTYDFTGGAVGGTNPNNFSLDYDVDLTVGPNAVAMNGTMDGLFRGTRADPGDLSPVKAIDASDASPTITVGAGLNGATASVIGETVFPTQ